MTVLDIGLFLLLAIVMPVFSAISFRRYVRRARAGKETPRPKLYRETQIIEWSLFTLLALTWLFHGRAWHALGISPPSGGGFLIASLIAGLICVYFGYAWRAARVLDDDSRRQQRATLGDLIYVLPRTRNDYRHFVALSVTAGIVEELVYRGFLFWFLAHWMPTSGVLIVSAVIFGLGHSYQGFAGVLRITAAGLVFGALYWLSGSIWVPMLLHAVADILQGAMLTEIWRPAADARPKSADA